MKTVFYRIFKTTIFSCFLLIGWEQPLNAQCEFPTHNVAIGSPSSNTDWTCSQNNCNTRTTGGTRSKTVQIGTNPNIYMRVTWVARSHTGVSVPNWDQTSGYGASWQPIVQVPNATGNGNMSRVAWAEFRVEFASHSSTNNNNNFNNNPYTFPCLSMTILDLDGGGTTSGTSNVFREEVWVSAPAMPYGIAGSSVTSTLITDGGRDWIRNTSGFPVFNNIDSSIKAAMVQMNFENVQEFHIRIGVIGTTSSNTQRQNSLWFMPFGQMNIPLPVVYISHNVRATINGIVVDWTTSQEENNSHFEVEKSTDGVFWTKIGQVDGCGNCHSNTSYEFTDYTPVAGHNLYRLKQVDYDGQYQYSPIKRYFWEASERNILIYPNPAQNVLTIEGIHNPDIKVYSMTGSLLFEQNKSNSADISKLPAGVYFIEIKRGAQVLSIQRILKE